MRSIKFTTATAAAAALLTLAPAAALAGHGLFGRRGAPASGCRLVLNVAPRLLTAGDTTLAFGHLSCASREEGVNQTVTLYQNAVGSPGGFTVAGTTTTLAHGVYDLPTGPLSANSRFYAVADGAQSPTRTVRVQAQVILSGPANGADLLTAGLRTGRRNRVAFSGKVTPEDVGAIVVLQRQNALTGNEWHRIQLGRVEAGGNFSIIHAFVVPGDANIRVLIRSQHHNVPSPSNELNYEISQAENPQPDDRELGEPDRLRRVHGDQRQARRRGEHAGDAARAHGSSARVCTGRAGEHQRQRRIRIPRPVTPRQHLLQGAGRRQDLGDSV